MAKRNCICTGMSILIMLAFPWCAVTFIKGDGGMAAVFLLFYVIDPIAAAAVGVFSGRYVPSAWFQPLFLGVLFILGSWISFEMGQGAFVIYGLVYVVLGYTAMLITWLILKIKERKKMTFSPDCHP